MSNDEITVINRSGIKVIEVDIKRAKYNRIPWVECSEYQKRKFENFHFLANQNRNIIKFLYI